MAVSELVVTCGNDDRKKVLVVSHERSGTHFLMNALAANFGYIATPWVNLDFELGLNFYCTAELQNFFAKMHDRSVRNIIKSHHQFGFYEGCLDYVLEQFHVFYVYRSPLDVMASCWRLVSSLAWDEGPTVDSPSKFMRTAPGGGMLRYQKRQADTMLHRWRDHVEGWVLELPDELREQIIYVRYDHLDQQFEATIRGIGERMKLPLAGIQRPDRDANVIVPYPEGAPRSTPGFSAADEQFAQEVAGQLLETLDFGISVSTPSHLPAAADSQAIE